jgi:hypothetical protein
MEFIGSIIFVGVLTVVLGTVLAALAGGVVMAVLRGRDTGAAEFLLKPIGYAYLSAGWMGALFLAHALFVQPDLEPLPEGYALRDDSDAAGGNLLVNLPAQDGGIYGTAEGPDTATDVSRLQIAGHYMLGQADHLAADYAHTGGVFFLLDMRTRLYARYDSEAALGIAAKRHGITLALESIGTIQRRYAFDADAQLFLVAGVLPPLLFGAYGLARLLRWRRQLKPSSAV